ncbi:nucleotide-diphospho-sugar transferase [Linderina pennispora]|uniref:Translation initiation factor eIF2B subunit gamma n=1 Tax=Linderina pennispora TaxID=61395 RepID=A0A1Y1WFA0_9FUNG|nr:nucleotide-diphospho-sugar transferase [Linderina pennispora]ORX72179.1 nucleotide-diphospho-sugar transferase [Linderina pennispora]
MFGNTAQGFDVATPEFKAIILAGPGNDLYPLTERENTPKALLPIANKPMIWYVLQWLEQGGVLDIEIVTVRESEPDISDYIRGVYEGMAKITVRVLSDAAGTADALRQVAPQIKTDVIVVPCDLIIDVPAAHFLDMYRLRRPSVASMFFETMRPKGGGGTSKAAVQLPLIGIDQPTSRLVMLRPLDKDDDEVELRMSLVRKFPSLAMSNKMQDSHVYVFQRWVLDYLAAHPEMSSLQDDLLPMLVRAQSQPQLLEREQIIKFMRPRYARHIDENDTSAQSTMTIRSRFSHTCAATALLVRANRIPMYCDLNRVVTRVSTDARIDESVDQAQRIQVGTDSLVGAYSKLGERCSVKLSMVGAHCVIGKDVKITNCVIMDHVTIGDGVKLESCVVCKLAKIGDKAQLKDCEIGASGEMFAASTATSSADGIQVKFT